MIKEDTVFSTKGVLGNFCNSLITRVHVIVGIFIYLQSTYINLRTTMRDCSQELVGQKITVGYGLESH